MEVNIKSKESNYKDYDIVNIYKNKKSSNKTNENY